MFFLFKIFSAILNFLAPPQKPPANAVASKLSDFQFPRAGEGDPVPRWYGTLKYKAPNTIWDGDFEAKPIKKKVSTGLFSSKKIITGYQYKIGLDLAVCLGPCFTFRRIWAGSYELWNGCIEQCTPHVQIYTYFPKLFGGPDQNGGWEAYIDLYSGAYDQPQNDYLQSKIFAYDSDEVPAYNGVAHMVFRHAYVGNSTSIQAIYVEGSCFPDNLALADLGINVMTNGLDMNPVSILYHIFEDDWGCLGIDAAKINTDQWRTIAQTVWNAGNGSSLVVSNAGQAADAVKALLQQINATMYENPATGLYDLVLLQDDYDVDTIPTLGPAEISSVQNFTKTLWSQTLNTVRIKFTDRTQDYKEDVTAQAIDFANIRFQKKPRPSEIEMQTVYDPIVANNLAARELSNVNVPLYSTSLTLNRMGYALPPGSVFKFTWPEYNIVSMIMRVRKLGLGTLADGTITMDVVQDVFSVADAIMSAPAGSPYVKPTLTPGPILAPMLFELPYWLDNNAALGTLAGQQSIAVIAAAPEAYSIGFNGYVVGTRDDAEVLSVVPYAVTAKLNAVLNVYDGFVAGVLPTLVIKTISDATVLVAGSVASGSGLFLLNNEIMAYENFHDNGDGTYNMLNVHRALFDTVYASAAANDVIYFIANSENFVGNLVVGTEVDFKLADVTSAGEYPTPATIPFTPTDRRGLPLPPDALAVAGVRALDSTGDIGGTVTLTWRPRSRVAAPATVLSETDAAEPIEAGEMWRLDVCKLDGTVLATQDGLAAPTVDILLTDDMPSSVVLKVWSKFGTVLSYSPAIYPLAIIGSIFIDGDRIVIDGDGILM